MNNTFRNHEKQKTHTGKTTKVKAETKEQNSFKIRVSTSHDRNKWIGYLFHNLNYSIHLFKILKVLICGKVLYLLYLLTNVYVTTHPSWHVFQIFTAQIFFSFSNSSVLFLVQIKMFHCSVFYCSVEYNYFSILSHINEDTKENCTGQDTFFFLICKTYC